MGSILGLGNINQGIPNFYYLKGKGDTEKIKKEYPDGFPINSPLKSIQNGLKSVKYKFYMALGFVVLILLIFLDD